MVKVVFSAVDHFEPQALLVPGPKGTLFQKSKALCITSQTRQIVMQPFVWGLLLLLLLESLGDLGVPASL